MLGGVVAGSACKVRATDDERVARVDFLISGTTARIARDRTAPWNCRWDTRTVKDGKHLMLAKAYDASGNVAQARRRVVVDNGRATPAPAPPPALAPSPPGTRSPPPPPAAAPLPDVAPSSNQAPFGAGMSSGNHRLNAGYKRTAIRWVAKASGTLSKLHVMSRLHPGGSNNSSYFAGTLGTWQVSTYRTTIIGTPNTATGPLVTETFSPDLRESHETIALNMGFAVTEGQEYVTVLRNGDPNPAVNYSSVNYLYSATGDAEGLVGAQARNERDPLAKDVFYGLDPREIVMASRDSGATWMMPGAPDGAIITKHLPVYLQEFANGVKAGQPYYSAHTLDAGTPVVMTYRNIPDRWRITHLGAYLAVGDSFQARLTVNGAERGAVTISGSSAGMVRVALPEVVTATPGDVVKISATPTATGSLKSLYSSLPIRQLLGQGPSYRWSFEGQPDRVVPLYPLPSIY